MQFLHMHHAMANKAIILATARNGTDPWKLDMNVLREIVESGAVDYRSHENITVTDADRQIVLDYLTA